MAWRPAGRTLPLRASTAGALSSGPPGPGRAPGARGGEPAVAGLRRRGPEFGAAGSALDAGTWDARLLQGLQGGEDLPVRRAVGRVRTGVQVGDLAGAVDDHDGGDRDVLPLVPE